MVVPYLFFLPKAFPDSGEDRVYTEFTSDCHRCSVIERRFYVFVDKVFVLRAMRLILCNGHLPNKLSLSYEQPYRFYIITTSQMDILNLRS